MTIRISRNETGNCINFIGSTNPAYWNACLSAVINSDNSDLVDIVNDIRSENSSNIEYEFYAVDYADFSDKDGNDFTTAQEMVDYVNANANVVGVSDVGADMTGVDVNFRLDATSTSIILDNGSSFGVNTIKAVADTDGTIHLHAIGAGSPDGSEDAGDHKHFEKLEHTRVSVDGVAAVGGLNDVVNVLNELFTVGPFEAVVIADPYSTMIADVAGVEAAGSLVGNAVNPSNSDVAAGSAAHYNQSGWMSTDTIDQAGEYFTFDIRVEGIIGMGLVADDASDVIGNASYGDPANFCVNGTNSGHWGYQFGHFFHPSPNGPWTNYGASTGYIMGPGWSNATHKFSGSPEGADWLAGAPVKMRVGLDANGFISIDYYDNSESTWITCARTSYPTTAGVEYRLGIKLCDSYARLASIPKIHELAAVAPTMYFRYVESPDGVYHYPLFATEEEAKYYDEIHNGLTEGTGSAHTHTYADDPTSTTWYMPEASHDATNYTFSVVPGATTFSGNNVTYTEITTLTDADLTPANFSSTDYTYEEGTAVNFQLLPAGASFSQTVTVSPSGSGMVYNSATGYLQGTLADVGADTIYTVTVTRANAYGSSVGTFEVQATDVAPVQTNDTPWTKALDFSGSNEHGKQVSTSSLYQPLQMAGLAQVVGMNTSPQGNTSNHVNSRPWATSVVFKSDGHSSNQIIWVQGEGASTNNDNIYLQLTSSGDVVFAWGREGVGYNKCRIAQNISSSNWYGVAIAHSGERLSGNSASASNLADCFDIRLMSSSDSFASISSNLSTSSNWFNTGTRMDRTIAGSFSVGGHSNTSYMTYRGKVASMVITTLEWASTAMPDATELELMITDPTKWETDYKIGNTYRRPLYSSSSTNYQRSTGAAFAATQIWLMGDGTSDSYANGIRSQVYPSDQNNAKMQLNSRVSHDIETVNIPGLT